VIRARPDSKGRNLLDEAARLSNRHKFAYPAYQAGGEHHVKGREAFFWPPVMAFGAMAT
jgi:hypothetical protein